MKEEFVRTASLIGENAVNLLQQKKVAVFGLGGVGGHTAEALVRAGIGSIDLIDSDCFTLSNINRQIGALQSTVGKEKALVLKQRFLDINPSLKVNPIVNFYDSKSQSEFALSNYDYIVDAIDSVSSKLLLIENAQKSGVKIISSMGTGNKLDPLKFQIADIYKTSVCPLAKVMRYELKKRGVKSLKCLYSKEEPVVRATPPASISFIPATAGLIIAAEVIKDLL